MKSDKNADILIKKGVISLPQLRKGAKNISLSGGEKVGGYPVGGEKVSGETVVVINSWWRKNQHSIFYIESTIYHTV